MSAPIVMIHGAFCAGWAFDRFRTPFEAAGHAVRAPTLRWHDCGRRPPPELGLVSLRDYRDDLIADISAFTHGEPPVLIGHSMGGLIAQMIAAAMPVRALVLLAPSAPWGVMPGSLYEVASAFGLYLAGDFWTKPLPPKRWIAYENALDRMPQDAREHIFSRFVPESGRATFEIFHWMQDLERGSYVHARDVTCPVMVIAGERDRVNTAATARAVAMRYRGHADFWAAPERSHWLHEEEDWEEIAERALRFIAAA